MCKYSCQFLRCTLQKGISQIKENANEPLLSQHRSHRTKRSRTLLKKPSLVVWAIVRGLISRMETALVGFSQVICSWGPGTPPEARRRGHVAPSKAGVTPVIFIFACVTGFGVLPHAVSLTQIMHECVTHSSSTPPRKIEVRYVKCMCEEAVLV
jgi:hypothetical protein